jgi:hypothetical protein
VLQARPYERDDSLLRLRKPSLAKPLHAASASPAARVSRPLTAPWTSAEGTGSAHRSLARGRTRTPTQPAGTGPAPPDARPATCGLPPYDKWHTTSSTHPAYARSADTRRPLSSLRTSGRSWSRSPHALSVSRPFPPARLGRGCAEDGLKTPAPLLRASCGFQGHVHGASCIAARGWIAGWSHRQRVGSDGGPAGVRCRRRSRRSCRVGGRGF